MIITEVEKGKYPANWENVKWSHFQCEVCGIIGWIKWIIRSWNNHYKCFYCDCEYFDEDSYM